MATADLSTAERVKGATPVPSTCSFCFAKLRRTPKGYARINCGVVLLNLADPSLAARTWDVDTCGKVCVARFVAPSTCCEECGAIRNCGVRTQYRQILDICCGSKPLRSHFGVRAPPILVYCSGDWDAHRGYDLDFAHGHFALRGAECLAGPIAKMGASEGPCKSVCMIVFDVFRCLVIQFSKAPCKIDL